jgi:tetratricopeptide (TPR) repeat protein
VIALYLSTIVHELGHALAGRLLGLRVWRIVVGSGPTLAKHKVFATELQLGAIPIGGLTFLHPESQTAVRSRYWLSIAAGPATTATLLALGVSLREATSFIDGIAPFQMLALANGLLLLSALVPLRLSGGMGLQATDGWSLLNLPFLPESRIADVRCVRPAIEIVEALERGDDHGALELSEAAHSRFPESRTIAFLKASAHLALQDFERARTLFVELAARSDLDRGQRLLLQNNLAWTNLQLNDDRLLSEADGLSELVVRELPRTAWANGTRGAVLVQLGRAAEGRRHLKAAFDHNRDPQTRAHNAAWLAVAVAKLGNATQAGEWLALAERLDPKCSSLPRARAALEAASECGLRDRALRLH